jgi:hypothetical protein
MCYNIFLVFTLRINHKGESIMNTNYRFRVKLALVFFSFTLSVVMAQSQSQEAKQILDATGIKGGPGYRHEER